MGDDTGVIERYLAMPKETRGIEFKEAKVQYSKAGFLDYCVAIANCGGGELVLGITDSLPRKVCGSEALRAAHEMELLAHEKLSLDVHILEYSHDDARVVVVKIPSRLPGVPVHNGGRYSPARASRW